VRTTLLLATVLLFSPTLAAQQRSEWQRVYTFDDSIIEMNTSLIIPVDESINRFRFRWTLDKPEPLFGDPLQQYKSRLEVVEIGCSDRRYRIYHVTYFDRARQTLHIDDTALIWRVASPGMMMEKLVFSACELIRSRTQPKSASNETKEWERAAKYAFEFYKQLENTKNFRPIIQKYFVPDYLDGYLADRKTKWFFNLKPSTAGSISHAELQRYYVALLNTGYLTSLYVLSQHSSDTDMPRTAEELLPGDVLQMINQHPYTTTYRGSGGNYDYLAENIDSVERFRSYTNLLERIGESMRRHVISVAANQSKGYRELAEDMDLFSPKVHISSGNYLGLPNGTKLFRVNVPLFRLELAEVNGDLKVVSATTSFQ
jgi:hypothetical protein